MDPNENLKEQLRLAGRITMNIEKGRPLDPDDCWKLAELTLREISPKTRKNYMTETMGCLTETFTCSICGWSDRTYPIQHLKTHQHLSSVLAQAWERWERGNSTDGPHPLDFLAQGIYKAAMAHTLLVELASGRVESQDLPTGIIDELSVGQEAPEAEYQQAARAFLLRFGFQA